MFHSVTHLYKLNYFLCDVISSITQFVIEIIFFGLIIQRELTKMIFTCQKKEAEDTPHIALQGNITI